MKQIDKLIICSPYKEPHQHWDRNPINQEFYMQEGRRPAGYTISGKGRDGNPTGITIELKTVNQIRGRLKEWILAGRPGITGITKSLLDFWYESAVRKYPFFFCQLEAIETIIFMVEAPEHYKTGIELKGDGGEFVRWCNKMATGSGKTIVMAMLIAWNVLNKVTYRQDTRFSKNVLIVAPGLTVKSRLSVLQPENAENYYLDFAIVPPTMMDTLRQGKVKIINWHMLAWDSQEKLNTKVEKGQLRSVDKRNHTEVSNAAYAKMVLGEMATAKNILVINDEAHHAWRVPAEVKEKGKTLDEIDNTVWIGGLDKLNKQVNILRCHDLSATPFAPSGKKSSEEALFSWVISDFGLNDAIESGLVKTPRVVIRDDGKYTSEYQSRLYHLYTDDEVKVDLNQKKITKQTQLPDLVRNAYNLLGADWLKTKEEWIKSGEKIPPVMMTVTNTTETADRIKYYFDSGECEIKELCAPQKTLQIDSKILGKVENEDDGLSGSQREQAESLREKVDTVGKAGKAGEQIQNVISVAMLSEGWDANNVTHIMGLRAFSSQLLCEQVIGRGLRRVSYEFDEQGMLSPEYVNIFGVPFSFIPHEGGTVNPRPPRPKVPVEPVKEKVDYEISFPNILRVDMIYRSKLELNFAEIPILELDPDSVITKAEFAGVLQGDVRPGAMSEVDLKKMIDEYRMQTVLFRVATRIFATERQNWNGDEFDFLSQLLKITEAFMASDKLLIKTNLFNTDKIRKQILLTLNASKIINHINTCLRKQNVENFSPVFDSERPILSTGNMGTWYSSKPNEWFEKTHINLTVFDSTWEVNNAKIINEHESVAAFVKNDHLGFVIKYSFNGVVRNYYPDYIIRLNNGDHLVLEVKGQDKEEDRVKRSFLDLWVNAVNIDARFGNWSWAVVFNSSDIYDILDRYKEFPKTAFLPYEEKPEILELQRFELSNFYQISIQELSKQKTLDDMIHKVMELLLKDNLKAILGIIKEAASSSEIDELQIEKLLYSKLDSFAPEDDQLYENRVRNWFKPAKELEKQSLSYLVSSEFLFDSLMSKFMDDFSPYVLQVCRAVESELKLKIFKPFTNYIRNKYPDIKANYGEDLKYPQVASFANMVLYNNHNHTMGNMTSVCYMSGDKNILNSSLLIQDFREYIMEYHSTGLLSKLFLDKISNLTKNYRNKAAHTETVNKETALDAKFLVRELLLEFIDNIKKDDEK